MGNNWETVNTSTTENVLNMQVAESKDFSKVVGKPDIKEIKKAQKEKEKAVKTGKEILK